MGRSKPDPHGAVVRLCRSSRLEVYLQRWCHGKLLHRRATFPPLPSLHLHLCYRYSETLPSLWQGLHHYTAYLCWMYTLVPSRAAGKQPSSRSSGCMQLNLLGAEGCVNTTPIAKAVFSFYLDLADVQTRSRCLESVEGVFCSQRYSLWSYNEATPVAPHLLPIATLIDLPTKFFLSHCSYTLPVARTPYPNSSPASLHSGIVILFTLHLILL